MGWNGTTGFLSAPLSVKDISDAIVFPSNDVGQLCTEGNTATPQGYIKMWAKYKPFRSSVAGYTTVSANQTAAAQHDFGLGTAHNGHGLVFNYATDGAQFLEVLYNEARDSGNNWAYYKPRGLTTYNEWFRMFDFAGYNSNATYPPITVTFTPDVNNRNKATFLFEYPGSGSAYDMHIKDFSWYTSTTSGSENNWKYGLLSTNTWRYNLQVGNQSSPTLSVGPDIYLSDNVTYNSDPGETDWSIATRGFTKEVTIQRGRRRYFVPIITNATGSNGSFYNDTVFLHVGGTDICSIPQTVTTNNLKNIWFPGTPTIYSHDSWSDLKQYGGSIVIEAELDGMILAYDSGHYVDVDFRLASSYGDGSKTTEKVSSVFFVQQLNVDETNYYNQSSEPSPITTYHERLAFTIDVTGGRFLDSNTELYLQVYEKDSGLLLDEIYIDTVPVIS